MRSGKSAARENSFWNHIRAVCWGSAAGAAVIMLLILLFTVVFVKQMCIRDRFISVALLLALSVPSVFGITENATTSYDVSLPAFQQHATLREGNRRNNKANVYAYNRITKPNCTAYIWFDKMVDDNIYQATERQFCSYNATDVYKRQDRYLSHTVVGFRQPRGCYSSESRLYLADILMSCLLL